MIEGNNLWNAVDLFIRAAKEIDSLEAEVSQKMTERLKTVGGELGFKSDKGDEEVLDVASDWVRVSSILQWGVREKSKRTSYSGNISINIVLWSEDDVSTMTEKCPRIEVAYVGYDEKEIICADYLEAGTWLTQIGWEEMFPKNSGINPIWPKSVKQCRGVRWNEKANWIFIIPLFSVNNTADIDQLIIEPAMKLLSGSAPEKALQGVSTILFAMGKEDELLTLPA